MKNVSLFPALITIFFAFGCNRNPEEQKSKATIEENQSPMVDVKKERIGQLKSNSYEAFSKPELAEEFSESKQIFKVSKPVAKQNPQEKPIQPTLTKTVTNNPTNLYDIFKEFEKPFQSFTFSQQNDTVLTGKEGTTLRIKANSFVSEKNNQPINGPVELRLKEYYSVADILLANLSTKSGNEMLETGGMVYLEAYSGNEKLKLKNGSKIEIGFPYQTKKDGMQVFNGEWENNIIKWKLDSTNFKIFEFVDEMPRFPGGEVEMQNFINRQIRYPKNSERKGIQGLVVLSFVVDKEGSLKDFNILKEVAPDISAEAIRVVKSMPNWTPGRKGNQAVSTRYTLPIRFTIDGYNTNDKKYAEDFEKISSDSLQKSDLTSVSKYLLSTSDLGWINCDRFNQSTSKIDFVVKYDSNIQQDIKMVFHKIKSVIGANYENGKFIFQNIPLNERVTLIALKKENNKPYLAIKETNTSKLLESEITYKEVTLEILKNEMHKLNRIN